MNKEFIPYEQALELKELGFDEYCFRVFNKDGNIEPVLSIDTNKNSDRIILFSERTTAPLYQQAFRWFREKYGLFTRVDFNSRYDDLPPYYDFTIGDMNHYIILNERNEEFTTYEEAELACLKKLIEIVKQK